jgi:hypothetical protein
MNGRKRGCRIFFALSVRLLSFLAAAGFAHAALAESVEVAPGIQVTKKTYSAPVNEQPFFGFTVKTDAQREADDKFVKALLDATGTREKALEEITNRGWRALGAGKLGEAAQRFNQAFLVDPKQSVVYHGPSRASSITASQRSRRSASTTLPSRKSCMPSPASSPIREKS